MIVYQRRELNLDGTWKEKPRARSKLAKNSKDNFGFLEYAQQGSQNFKNPLDVLKTNHHTKVGLQI